MSGVVIGDRVRVKRGAEVRRRRDRTRVRGNREVGTVRQVWRGDRLVYVELDRDGLRYVVPMRDLRRPTA